MIQLLSNLKCIAAALGAAAGTDTPVTGCSIDSRTIRPGELFVALRGPRTDGHLYVEQALAAGAAGAVVAEHHSLPAAPCDRLIAVPDTLEALQRLAAANCRQWHRLPACAPGAPLQARRLVAVTGSAGKTTTKEMIAAALATRFRVRKTEGNLNNDYGLPLSLLRLEDDDQVGVFELAMSRAGEIARLARLAAPDTGVVTNVAPVHLEFFSSLEEIARAKYELIQALPPDGTAVLNADDPRVSQFDCRGRVLTFGIERPAEFRGENIREGAGVTFEALGTCFELSLPGRHNVLNALAALAVASTFEIPAAEVARALAAFRPSRLRGESREVGGATFLDDCYNSNPLAAESMLDFLARAPTSRLAPALGAWPAGPGPGLAPFAATTPARGRRLAVLGEMLELGPAAPELHRQVGARVARAADYLVAVRGLARHFLEGAAAAGMPAERMCFVETPAEAAEFLAGLIQPGDLVLFKASRGVKLEAAMEKLEDRLGARASGPPAGGRDARAPKGRD